MKTFEFKSTKKYINSAIAVVVSFCKTAAEWLKNSFQHIKEWLKNSYQDIKEWFINGKPRTTIIAIILAASVLLGSVGGIVACNSCGKSINVNRDDNSFAMLDFKFTDQTITDTNSAISAAAECAKTLGFENAGSELSEVNINTLGGNTYYRLQQQFNGIPVYGRNAVVAADENGNALSLSSNLSDMPDDIILTPALTSEEAANTVQAILGDSSIAYTVTMTIYSLFGTEPELTWQVFAQSGGNSYHYFVSALTGEIVAKQCLTYTDTTATGYGKDIDGEDQTFNTTLQDDGTYLLWDQARDIQVLNANGRTLNYCIAYAQNDQLLFYYDYYDEKWHNADGDIIEMNYTIEGISPNIKVYDANKSLIASDVRIALYAKTGAFLGKVWGIEACTNDSTVWSDEKAVTALTSIAASYDFYNELFGRDSFNGKNGSVIVVYNDYKNSDSSNAYQWGAETDIFTLISFGKDNLMPQDTTAHEYTHAVESTISSMAYEGESGAVMEALSDIFGELVEDWKNDGLDNDCDWIHGKRSLEKPSDYNYPDTYLGRHWKNTSNPSDNNDHGGVHTNNTVLSHAAYLMCHPGKDGVALSTEQLANLMYRTMFMLPSDCTFAQFRYCVEATAKIMLKNGELYDENLERISAAFDEVGVKTKSYPTYDVKPESTINVYCADKSVCGCFSVFIRELGQFEYVHQESTIDGFINLPQSLNSGSYVIDIFAYGENIACVSVNISNDYSKNVLDIYTDYEMPLMIAVPNDGENSPVDKDEAALYYEYIRENLKLLDVSSFPYSNDVGIFSALIEDFDSDGVKEMVTASISLNDADQKYIILDLYGLNGDKVKKWDTSTEFYASGVGNFSNDFCVTYENQKLRIQTITWSYGGSSHGEEYATLIVNNNKFVLENDFVIYEFYRYDDYRYREDVSGKIYSSPTEIYDAIQKSEYTDHSHSYDDNDSEHFKGNHMFTVMTSEHFVTDGVYGFIHDNTNLISCIENSQAYADNYIPEINTIDGKTGRESAYLQVIENLIAKYGEGKLIDDGNQYKGLSTVRLIDFDNDGNDELFCAYSTGEEGLSTNKYRVYGYTDKLIDLVPESDIYVAGTDYSPYTEFVVKDGKTYLLTCSQTGSAWMDGSYLAFNGHSMTSIFSYENYADWWEDPDGHWKINGVSVDSDTYQKKMTEFYDGCVVTSIFYYGAYYDEWINGEHYVGGINPNDIEVTHNTIDYLISQENGIPYTYPQISNTVISSISVSGNLGSAGERSYVGENTIDGNFDTSWIVNTTEDGAAGAWIQYNLAGSYTISGLKMINGNVYKDGYYYTNGHIKDFRLDFSDGTSLYFTANEIESRNLNDNTFTFDKPITTSYVKLTVLSSYIGTKEAYRTNTAMTEIEFF